MRLGFRTAGFAAWPIERTLRALKELGYDGVEVCLEIHELCPGTVTPERLSGVGRALAGSGLELASVSYHADGEDLTTRVPNTIRAVEMTCELGCGILIVNAERADADRRAEQWRALVGRFRRICERAEECQVWVAVEPEPLLLVHGMDDWARLRDEVASDRLAINLDIGHCEITDDVPAAIRRFASHIVHVHFEDIRGKVHQHLVPGEGDMDLSAVVRALREVDYDGYLTIDLFHIADDPLGYAQRCLEPMRRLMAVYGPVAPERRGEMRNG
ncbi:MAG TPA: sugar phosphate isomerase/epimerase family protein [Armatimonadota bacterium]|mgnify:CR=1 FL=1|nr:sugar phosphate isomerase/epimerase family protein [Armatimonadota bacterium]